MTGRRLGELCSGFHIYVYACSALEEGPESFAQGALDGGCEVVVGHDTTTPVPDKDLGYTAEQLEILRDAATSMIRAFLDGEEDEGKLKLVGIRTYSVLEKGDLLELDKYGSPFLNAAMVLNNQQLSSGETTRSCIFLSRRGTRESRSGSRAESPN